ncbi:MAG: prepilin-type N-terminal cleavage/methylation domain-containing protein [Syntrophales bacterium LBB04]|nr:prepilin-type N-terminal cleavage/methylation domain-containing protein [Syntrophales bacterium LBB04]
MQLRDVTGFTLVELMIAMGITMGLLAAVWMAVNSAQRHSSAIERKVTAQQDVKPALDLMAMEIGMASYNPQFKAAEDNLWVNPTGSCTAAATNQSYRGIQEATANSIVVEMDIGGAANGEGDGMLGDDNEVIRYNYDTANQYITRAVNCGTADPFLGARATSNTPRTVRVINNTAGTGNTAIPVFRYYDCTGTEIAATGLPAGIPNICRIEVVLAVETEDIDPNTGQTRKLIYSTSIIPRNHAIR